MSSDAASGEDRHRVLQGIQVLVVDDSSDMRLLMRTILQNSGATVSEAADVADALAQIRQARPHVIFDRHRNGIAGRF